MVVVCLNLTPKNIYLTKVYINLTDQREPSLDFVSESKDSIKI